MSIYSFKFVASACRELAKLKCILAITALSKPLLKIVPILKHKSNVAQLLHLSIPHYLKKINKSVYLNVHSKPGLDLDSHLTQEGRKRLN
jgi:hypothetical protein